VQIFSQQKTAAVARASLVWLPYSIILYCTVMKRSKRLRNMGGGSLAAIGMALALGVLVAMVSVPASAVVVNFPDPGLEAAIRDAIGKPTGDIHDSDLVELTWLGASSRSIAAKFNLGKSTVHKLVTTNSRVLKSFRQAEAVAV